VGLTLALDDVPDREALGGAVVARFREAVRAVGRVVGDESPQQALELEPALVAAQGLDLRCELRDRGLDLRLAGGLLGLDVARQRPPALAQDGAGGAVADRALQAQSAAGRGAPALGRRTSRGGGRRQGDVAGDGPRKPARGRPVNRRRPAPRGRGARRARPCRSARTPARRRRPAPRTAGRRRRRCVEVLELDTLPQPQGDAFAARTGFDPREEATPYRWFRIRPRGIQAWREADELRGRRLMRDGRWLVS
jgi:hypothetical protein